MAIIRWRDSYSVGIEQFDKDHQILVGLVNQVYEVIRDKESAEVLDDAVEKLVDYTCHHFQQEEEAMERAGFSGLEEHCREHQMLTDQVQGFQERVKRGDHDLKVEFYHFLREWLLDHIMGLDKQYADHLRRYQDKAA